MSLPLGPFSSCHEWIHEADALLDQEKLAHLVSLLWSISNRQNYWIHDAKLTLACFVAKSVKSLLMDIASAHLTKVHHPPHTRMLNWSCPTDGLIKINVETSFFSDTDDGRMP
ncbi:hypothetical protein V6N12_057285 [Hibiscus sabdariffa]|uniref:Uncharacterized protein n=1 Tax=Hibiscus sabdariffa TaxID=183260 RepID=A0ABR2DBE2_9ROSI